MHDPSAFPGQIPVIDTPRLRLRAHRLDDYAACTAMWADPAVVRHIGGKPSSAEDVWARMLRYAGHWALQGFGFWAIEEKSTSRFIGEVGFAYFKRDICPPNDDVPEMGWALVSDVHGQGFGREATGAALAWGDGHFAGRSTCCLIDPGNEPSIRVATGLGYVPSHRAAYKGQVTMVFTRPGPGVA
ncbi:GNAT family N-acetyltransferase [Pinirhizobacter soli]|uniref:GNAT family N-acetyltransferase n=1 Tax=Pinirhizobacter soli TaxID=2786953 RepID=UPI00202ABF8D|nr:GNAT family N-acetyltransferase [Pinirhizobacter soli]